MMFGLGGQEILLIGLVLLLVVLVAWRLTRRRTPE
jgi:hypothetical protein